MDARQFGEARIGLDEFGEIVANGTIDVIVFSNEVLVGVQEGREFHKYGFFFQFPRASIEHVMDIDGYFVGIETPKVRVGCSTFGNIVFQNGKVGAKLRHTVCQPCRFIFIGH